VPSRRLSADRLLQKEEGEKETTLPFGTDPRTVPALSTAISPQWRLESA